MTTEDKVRELLAERLVDGWKKYVQLFETVPHGTTKQMAALVEFSGLTTFALDQQRVGAERMREAADTLCIKFEKDHEARYNAEFDDMEGDPASEDMEHAMMLSGRELGAAIRALALSTVPTQDNPRCFCPDCHADLGNFYSNRIVMRPRPRTYPGSGEGKIVSQYCACCYGRKVFCRTCKTTHCGCSWSQCSRKSRAVTHRVIVRPGPFGGELRTTLCGRMSLQNDGMNVGEAITCKLCLRRERPAPGDGGKR